MSRRSRRLDRYDELRAERPAAFVNPPGAAYEIVFDPEEQNACADRSVALLREKGLPEEYGDIGVVYEDQFFIVLRDAVRFRDGSVRPYARTFAANLGTGAATLPVLPDGRIVLVRKFRHELRTWHWETPRGFAEPGEDGATTAKRELAEEAGVAVSEVELLGRVAAEGLMDEIYLARLDGLPEQMTAEARFEGLDEVRLVTFDELTGMIAGGEVLDEYLLAAYAFATARRLL